jgi:glycosyltransferase involved in cell wall biosynthesis
MKILMIIPYLASLYGGPAKVVRELAQSLGKFGLSVDVITTNANGTTTLDVPLAVWIQEEGYRVKYFQCWHHNDLILSLPLLQWLYNNGHSYDVIHTSHRFSPLILLTEWICQLHKIPYIVTPHGMLEPWALSYKAWKKKLYFRFLEQPALKQASIIHTLNSSEASNIQSLGFQHTVIIPNGISQNQFHVSAHPDIFYEHFPQTRGKTLILFMGRIDPKKGLDLLAPAFAEVHQQFPNTHLVIAGPDTIGFLSTVKDYFTQAQCLSAVTFTGMLTGELKQSALSAATLYVAPSYSEGFSMSVLEGMASGLPCILTKGCNFQEAELAQAAYVVNIEASSIATALINCLRNPQQARSLGKTAQTFVFQNYTWDSIAEKLIQVYAHITNHPPLVTSER